MIERPPFEATCLPLRKSLETFALRLTKYKPDALDLVQETYLRAFRAWDSFAPDGDPLKWLNRILRNAHVDTLRRKLGRSEIASEHPLDVLAGVHGDVRVVAGCYGDGGPQLTDGITPHDLFEDEELSESTVAIADAMGRLPEQLRELVTRAHLRGEAHESIAEDTKTPNATVRTRLFRARGCLRDDLGAAGGARFSRGAPR